MAQMQTCSCPVWVLYVLICNKLLIQRKHNHFIKKGWLHLPRLPPFSGKRGRKTMIILQRAVQDDFLEGCLCNRVKHNEQ